MKKRKEGEYLSMDRISELPEPILQAILCFLSQKTAVQTSVLSKAWRYLWCRRPVIEFDDMYEYGKDIDKRKSFLSALERILQGTLHLRLEKFSLHISKIDELISLLEEWSPRITSVSKLHLVLQRVPRLESELLPPLPFDSESIEELNLENFVFSHRQQNKPLYNFSRLRKLFLRGISRLPNGWFSSSCSFPCLEDLRLESCPGGEFDLSSCRSLKHLSFTDIYPIVKATINAPKIVRFHYIGLPPQHISFAPTTSSWKSNLRLKFIGPLNFNHLTGLLKALRESEISLDLEERSIHNLSDDIDITAGVYDDEVPAVVNQLAVRAEFDLFSNTTSSEVFLNIVFRICRPSVMHMIQASIDVHRVAEILVQEEREYFWQHDLERVVWTKDVYRFCLGQGYVNSECFALQWKGASA